MSTYRAGHTMTEMPLFPKIKILESILLRDTRTNGEMLLLHGHQADFLNNQLWRVSRFLVRHIWRPLERTVNCPIIWAGGGGSSPSRDRGRIVFFCRMW